VTTLVVVTTEEASRVISLRLGDELLARLEKKATDDAMSRNALIVFALGDWLRTQEVFAKAAERGYGQSPLVESGAIVVPSKSVQKRITAQGGEAVLRTDVVAAADFRITGVCPECKEKMADWDRQWRCKNCKKIFQK
jgi:predicted transcriptional regulator